MAALRRVSRVIVSASLALGSASLLGQAAKPDTHAPHASATQTLPLVFEKNQGQLPKDVAFVGRTERYSVTIGSQDLRFSLPGAHQASEVVLSLRGSQAAAPAGITEAPFLTNYFLGSDPAGYRTGIHNYTRIGLSHVYPGIDAEFYSTGNAIEHDFIVAPGADAALIEMSIAAEGKGATLSPAGDVVIAGSEGELRLKKPVAYQLDAVGRRTDVAAAFALTGDKNVRELRFQLGAYDHARRLVIDPIIAYGSFFDGKAGSVATAVATDGAGDLYLTGTTTAMPGDFGVASPVVNLGPPPAVAGPAVADVFVVKFGTTGTPAWLSYFGSQTAGSTSTSIALQQIPVPLSLVVGGSTTALDFPAVTASLSVRRGFMVSLLALNGTLTASAAIDSDPATDTVTTEVDGVAMDSLANVYAVGTATGGLLLTTGNAYPVDTTVVTSPVHKGFVYEAAAATLGTGTFVSYLSGYPAADTYLTSVAVPAIDLTSSLYVGGYTTGAFPLAGPYSNTNMNTHASDTGANDSFAAEIVPGALLPLPAVAATLTYSAWIAGTGDDRLNALAIDTTGNLLLFGQTTSPMLGAATTYTNATKTTPTAGQTGSPVTGTFPTKTSPGTRSGFAARLDTTGQPTVVTYLGAAGDDVVLSGTVSATGLVYAGGYSSSAQNLGYTTSVLPSAEDATSGGEQHGFVAQLASDLSAVNYVANIGGAAGPDSVVGVGLDAAGNSYAGGNISSSTAYTSSGAFQAGRTVTTGSSPYVAEISPLTGITPPITVSAFTCNQAANPTDTSLNPALPSVPPGPPAVPTTTASCLAGTPPATPPSPSVGYPDPISVPNAMNGTAPGDAVTYYFTVGPPAVALDSRLPFSATVQIPTVANLAFDTVTMTDLTPGAAPLTPTCTTTTVGATPPQCVIAVYPQTNTGYDDTFSLVIQAHLTATPTTATTLNIVPTLTASGFSGMPSTTEVSHVVVPAQLSIALTSQAPASGQTVYTTEGNVVQTNTQVSYGFTISNAAGAGDATSATFNFPSSSSTGGFVISKITPSSGSCAVNGDGSATCTGLSVLNGGTATVTVVGTYPDDSLHNAASASASSFTVTASGPFSFPSQTVTPGLTLQRGVHLVVVGSLADSTASNPGGYVYLTDIVSYAVKVTNLGPSATLGSDTLSVTIAPPSSGQSVKATFTPASGSPFSCSAASTTVTCTTTVGALGAGKDNTAGEPVLTGTFNDDATNTSIVATPVPVSFSTATTYVSDVDAGGSGSSSSSSSASVVRYAALAFSTSGPITTTAPVCGGGSPCVYMQNAGNTGYANYTFQVTNSGPDASEGTAITITLPSAPKDASNVYHALLSTTPVPAVTAGTVPTCSYTAASNTATPQITCTGGTLPKGAVLTVKGSLYADANAVPTTSIFDSSATGTGGSAAVTQTALGTPGNQSFGALEVDRAAHLVTTKTVAATGTAPNPTGSTPALINLAENTSPATAAGANDTVTVTTTVGTTALNLLPSASFADTLPPYFLVTKAPVVAGANGATGSCTAGDSSTGTAAKVACTLSNLAAGSSSATPTTQVTVTYSGKFVDNGVAADVTGASAAAKVAKLPAYTLPTAMSATTVAVDPGNTADATSSAPGLQIERLVHILARKTHNTAVAAPPAGTTYTYTYPNLDEKVGASTFGNNDEVEYDVAVANGGANKAVGVQFTDTLPPYFNLVKLFLVTGAPLTPDTGKNGTPGPALAGSMTCTVNGTALSFLADGVTLATPIATTGTAQLTCTYGTSATPLALSAGPAATPFAGTTPVELVYQGKFQDNAANTAAPDDNIKVGANTYAVPASTLPATAAASQAIDSSIPNTDGTSADSTSLTIQRAAHLTLVTPTVPLTDINGNALTKAADGTPIAAEAQPSTTTPGSYVFNCVRYKTYVQNSGPNAVRSPLLTVALPSGLNATASPSGTTTTPNADAALPGTCKYGSATPTPVSVTGVALAPLTELANASLVFDLDAYFGPNTLTGVNSLSGVQITYSGLSDSSFADTTKGYTFPAAGVKGPLTTVVNTPFGSNFSLSPFSATATQPVALTFGSVGVPGITSLTVSSSTTASLPKGQSPLPGSSSTAVNLYKTGSSPQFYSLGTTAATVSGNTGICVTNAVSGAALTDTFAKPERVLLWGLSGLPSGTTLQSVPNVTSTPAGDITGSVVAFGKVNYVQAGGPLSPYDSTHTALPAKQPQPLQICGNVNGFATAAAPTTLAVLEPVNFAPVITANPNSPTQTPGKGVSEVTFLFPSAFDYDNNDPCYVATTSGGTASRSTCDDNKVLTTRIYGGTSLVPSQTYELGPLTPDATATFLTQTYEVQAGQNLYDFVTDQLAEATFLTTNNCDPTGNPSTNPCSTTAANLTGNLSQEAIFTSGEIALLTPSVNGGSSALIIIPQAATPSSNSTGVLGGGAQASATVNAGQSVGFLWRLRLDTGTLSGTYNLACNMVDAATQTTVVPSLAGLSCQVPPTVTLPTDVPVYIVTQGGLYAHNSLGWKALGGTAFASLLLPFLLFRRRLSYPRQMVIMGLLMLVGTLGLSGCGSGSNGTSLTTTAVPAGTYWFRLSATPTGGGATTYSTAFSVKVVSGS